DSRHLIEVKESKGRGLGVVAIADIPRGTRVVAEAGLLQIDRSHTGSKDILRAFESRLPSEKSAYLELHAYACNALKRTTEQELGMPWLRISALHRKVLSIWDANTFGDVFPLGSRLNHSCIPNINFAYNPSLEKETFHAVRDIAGGDELTVMYINGVSHTYSQRQAELTKWGFTCTCPGCDTTAADHEEKEEKRAKL
ncbi:SET domain-containing protein, partial [Ophiobolus disseminans]